MPRAKFPVSVPPVSGRKATEEKALEPRAVVVAVPTFAEGRIPVKDITPEVADTFIFELEEYWRRLRNRLADEVVMVDGEDVPTIEKVNIGPVMPLITVEEEPPPEIPREEVATHVDVAPFVCKT